jgi:hypothetical protein
MKKVICWMTMAAGLLMVQAASAQTATPPAGSTGLCKDGTYSTAASKQGACRGHQGVKSWFAAPNGPAAPSTATSPTPVPAAPAPVAAPAPAAAPAYAPAAKPSPASKAAARPLAAGGGPGLVWVNSSSNVYHCYGTSFYGKTKEGSYMSEADAKAKGAHADHGKACSK